VNQLVRLVEDLMELSRVTRGTIELKKERVALSKVVHDALETARPLLDAAGHRLEVTLPDEEVVLHADPVRLTQVFANLLDNAAKYTDRAGRVWLTATRDGSHVAVSVCDQGIGIPEEQLPRIFEMFSQVDSAMARARGGGLGIGLTLVRSLVQLHGGLVEARSDGPGTGSVFIVRLPLATEEKSPRAGAHTGHEGALASTRILAVDDNRDAADSLGTLLELVGAEARVAYDGASALAAIRQHRPTIVLLDIGMPDVDGYEVARRVRSDPELDGVTLIALTGWGQTEDRRRSQEAGFDHHLVKPVDLAALQALLITFAKG
jgi:CheY-like chemotaxis protein/two-component sensor histidine kinase